MSVNPTNKKPGEVQTTGHSWDGIEELDTPMPRWWLWTFYVCILWAVAYSVLYPAWPLVAKATPGLLGYSTRQALEQDLKDFDASHAEISQKLVETELAQVIADPDLRQYATSAGAAVFRTNCIQCHGSGAAGGKGYPNLLDDDWLHGGTIEAIHQTIQHGIRVEADPDTRASLAMPNWSEMIEPQEITDVVQYVLRLSGQAHDEASATAGAEVFANNCVACHGEDGKGNLDAGAPNLTDAIWLYGGDEATLTQTITNGRAGVMPSWSLNNRLSEADIRSVAVYVHGLGGGQ